MTHGTGSTTAGKPSRVRQLAAVPALAAIALAGDVRADEAAPRQGADGALKPILEARLRLEDVDQAGVANEANAVTLRARLGFETREVQHTTLLVEGEAVVPLDDSYRPDPLDPSMAEYPVVADPEAYELNRVQLTNTGLPGTTLTLGRQRILLDDQRFVGNVGWRQNEQTFDAIRIVNRSLRNLVLDATYLNRVNRVYGQDSPQGTYKGDSVLLNASYQAKLGKVTGFGYLLEFDPIDDVPAAAGDSTSTWGVRFTGNAPAGRLELDYRLSWARQTDAGANPSTFDLDYALAELTARYGRFGFGAGIEVLDGNGVKGFTTPLATLHRFQGWADKFLATPADGLEDAYVNVVADVAPPGGLNGLDIALSYHDYDSARGSADYGSEWNVSVTADFDPFSAVLKYADYREGVLDSARDTTKLWLQFEYAWQ